MIAVEWTLRRIDRDVVMIDAEAVTLCIAIGAQPSLQHLVGRITDAWHDIGRRKCRLFDFGEYVFGVSVELEIPDFDQREAGLWPDFCQIEGVEPESLRLGVCHHLDEERPAREIPGLNAFET